MLVAAAVIMLIVTGFYIVFFVFIPIGRGAVFFPSLRSHARRMAELSGVGAGDRAVDLGSGDGRVVIALAETGAEAHGWEINPALVVLSRWNVRRAGLARRARIHWGSFWNVDLGRFQAVTVFQGSFVMRRLEKKVGREMEEGSVIVSDYFAFPGVRPEMTDGTILVYRARRGR